MGALVRWFIRLGAPGGTARWATKTYRAFREHYVDATESDSSIFRRMIDFRYTAVPDVRIQTYLLGRCDQVEGLMGLVIEILKVEASLAENEAEYMADIAEVLWEELGRSGLPHETLYGRASFLSDYADVMSEQPDQW